jgi:phosphoenolpyruvate carboxykinase (ATP)
VSQVFDNPSPDELRAFTEEMPETRISGFGNVNVQTTVLSRSAGSTYVVDRESSGKTMSRADYDKIAAAQEAYIAEHDMIVIDGYIGNDPDMRSAARLVMEKRYANVAGMQQKLYFERSDAAEPQVQVIYTPGLEAEGYPDDHTPRASSTPTTSVSRRRAACACGTTSSTARADSRCTPGSR